MKKSRTDRPGTTFDRSNPTGIHSDPSAILIFTPVVHAIYCNLFKTTILLKNIFETSLAAIWEVTENPRLNFL